MKKNRMMRLASGLLVAVLLSTCTISGTFAKYVTDGSADDTARVAKFGVVATVTGEAFEKQYAIKNATNDVDNNAITLSVDSSTEDDVIAPGTSGTFTGVALTGTPEVAVNVENKATITLTGWTLADGSFYCPVVITVEGEDFSGLKYNSSDKFIKDICDKIEDANGNYKANTDLSTVNGLNGDYTWEWAFEGAEDSAALSYGQTDAKDTELGNQAARGTLNKIEIAVTTTVTQID